MSSSKNGTPVFRAEDEVDDDAGEGLRHADDYDLRRWRL